MWLEKVGWAYGTGSRVSVQTNANYGSLEGRDHLDSSISFIVTQYSANAMCESLAVIFKPHARAAAAADRAVTWPLVRLLLVRYTCYTCGSFQEESGCFCSSCDCF
jgi:hypothetical protein